MTPRRSSQYVTGLCLAGLGVCAGSWLMVTAFIVAGTVKATAGARWDSAAVTLLVTGAGLALVAAVTFACWTITWRQVLRADGVLIGEARRRTRHQARQLARRKARQAAHEAKLEAAAERRNARQARALEKRERARLAAEQRQSRFNVALDSPDSDVDPASADDGSVRVLPGPRLTAGEAEPDPVRPPNADRVLAQLRDLLGPLLTALDADAPPGHAAAPVVTEDAAETAGSPGIVPGDEAGPDPAAGAQARSRSDLVSVGQDTEEA